MPGTCRPPAPLSTPRRALLALLTAAVAAAAGGDASAGEPPLAPVIATERPLFTVSSPLGDLTYRPARGLQVGDTGLHLGGYSNLTVTRNEGDPAVFDLHDLSFLAAWDVTARLHLFSELEVEHALEIDDEGHAGSPNARFTVERLYADFRVDDPLQLRGGVFLTPVGRWNVIHAAPLVWTTSRPLTTEIPFDPRSTGAMVFGTFFPERGIVSYALYGQFADVPEGNPPREPDDHAAGARLEYVAGHVGAGASYRASERDGQWRHLLGVDGLWRRGRLEVMGEAFVQDGPSTPSRWGFYLQPVVRLTRRLFFVQRYEHFDAATGPSPNLITLGAAFRPFPNGIVKGEYLIVDRRTPLADPGLRFSLAVLF